MASGRPGPGRRPGPGGTRGPVTLVAARVLAAATGGPPLIHRGPARQLARQELARSLYRLPWWERAEHAISTWLARLGTLGGRPLGWPALIVVIAVAVLAAAGILAWIGPARRTRRGRAAAVLGNRPMSAAEHRRAAEQLAATGDYAGAIVERMRALAVDLEARGILAPRAGRTATELAAEAAAALRSEAAGGPAITAGLARAARLFEDVRYGGRPGTRAGYEEVRDTDTRMAAVRAPQAAAIAGAGPPTAGAGAHQAGPAE